MKSKKAKQASSSFANPELQQIQQLLQFMTEHNLEEFEYSRGDLRIRLRKPSAGMVVAPRMVSAPEIIVSSAPNLPPAATPGAGSASASAEARVSEDLHLVKSPIVGTFYGSPSPGAEPFVKVGGHVDTGQTLCIVEAMKLMNEIESDATGKIVRCLATNGQAIEFGQTLFVIRPV